PSAAGVSRNLYKQFDVPARGVIVNNARSNVQSALGGWIQGNPYLATGPARIIVNEVSSSNPSLVNGPVEIAGQRAEFILANPSGISVNGGTFINAAGVTLTTGAPQYNAAGGLDSYVVRSGQVHLDGLGLDASKADYAAILARAVQINAALHAKDLKVVTGANTISGDRTRITPTTGTGAKPVFALDTAALGGMYANHIFLVGTEHGLGVRNGGNFLAPGEMVITADGRLENKGTIEAQRLQIAAAGDIDNRGGTMRQTGGAGLTVTADRLSNTGGVIGAEPVSVAASSGSVSASAGSGSAAAGPAAAGSGGAGAVTTSAPSRPGAITAAGAILNDGGRIFPSGPVVLNTAQIDNTGGSISVANLAVSGPRFSNAGGSLHVSNSFSADVGELNNAGGTLRAGNLAIATSGDLVNTDGTLASDSDAGIQAGGQLLNTRGTISAARHTTLSAGSVQGAGVLGAGVQAEGQLGSAGDLRVTSTGALEAGGHNLAAGEMMLRGASVDLSSSTTRAARIALTASHGNVITSGATITTPGSLSATADNQASQSLVHRGGKLEAGQMRLNVSNLANTHGGRILQTGSADTHISVGGALDNSAGTIASNGSITLAAGSLKNDAGRITALGDLGISPDGTASNVGGTLAATGHVEIRSGFLNNDAGLIQSGAAMVIDTHGQQLINTHASGHASGQGGIASGGTLRLSTGHLANTAGFIGAKNALRADTRSFANTAGGLVLGQSIAVTGDTGTGRTHPRVRIPVPSHRPRAMGRRAVRRLSVGRGRSLGPRAQ
ncbi:filamentous hemagglutinin N-terminal domain-containing protein, partial [Variovorax defluvii]|uniref:two-partner secretion domain-containing protein n=1 Tax=Variovorax defluvii TaxID=913761 RepID=UPI0031EBDEE5